MMRGIALLSLIPVRREASERSEMVTQLLFGETYTILESINDWKHIQSDYDAYQGYIANNQYTNLGNEELNNIEAVVTSELVSSLREADDKGGIKDNPELRLVAGSTLYLEGDRMRVAGKEFLYEGECERGRGREGERERIGLAVLETATRFLGTPYLWGGRSPFGIDCSGFTQVVFKICGKSLLRDASQQATQGVTINLLNEAQPGDLAFFDDTEGIIKHVGIILPENKIIHASGHVRIDTIDHQGIYNTETGKYSHALRLIKRQS